METRMTLRERKSAQWRLSSTPGVASAGLLRTSRRRAGFSRALRTQGRALAVQTPLVHAPCLEHRRGHPPPPRLSIRGRPPAPGPIRPGLRVQ
jgi:hypothetical protein